MNKRTYVIADDVDYIYFPQYCDIREGFTEDIQSENIGECPICDHKYINNKKAFIKSRYKMGECMCHDLVRQGILKTPEEFTIKIAEWYKDTWDEEYE